MIPVVPIYSSFYQRAYDQVIHDICLQNLPVVMCVDRAGLVGADGETHHGAFDMSFFKIIPNITILAPKDFKELEKMLKFAVDLGKPVVIRYPRGAEETETFEKHEEIKLGKAEILQEGKDITIVAIGKTVASAVKLAQELKKNKVEAEVINARFLKPFDSETIKKSINKTKNVITLEDNTIIGGIGSEVKEIIANEISMQNIKIKSYGIEDEFMGFANWEDLFDKIKNKV